jgi:very-short-patch-repair endonuclease
MARKASIRRARALRRSAPVTEIYLWKLLRNRRLDGLKFRRQVPIGPYVVDFLCLRHRLIVEADGPFHDQERDGARDAWLASEGFRVLRFSNHDIEVREHQVIATILSAVGQDGAIGRV